MSLPQYGPDNPVVTYVKHSYDEKMIDLGEIEMNYATAGSPDKPAIVLIPAQTESWWGYESAMKLLSKSYQTFAVDLRGQGRSSRTSGRYTFDNFGNDIVRFIMLAVGRPVIVSGLSSGGVISAWLSAYAPPGMIRGAHYEDPPLFACEISPAFGHSIKQAGVESFIFLNQYLGDQWKVGNWEGYLKAVPELAGVFGRLNEPPQNIKEYDPEWARAFAAGTVGAGCDHAQMLSKVKCPVLFTHHYRSPKPLVKNGHQYYIAAISDLQAKAVGDLVAAAGQLFTYKSFPKMVHSMHEKDPELYVNTITEWAKDLPSEENVKKLGDIFKKI